MANIYAGVNDDEAARCMDLADKYLQRGDYDMAVRMAQKAQRMYSRDAAAQRERAYKVESSARAAAASSVNSRGGASQPRRSPRSSDSYGNSRTTRACSSTRTPSTASPAAATSSSFGSSGAPEGLRHRTTGASSFQPSSVSASNIAFDRDVEAKCRSILKYKQDYYKVLGVPSNASVSQIKKSFRALALQIHPDKSKCPSAELAFKIISRAHQCLSNSESKRSYDLHGFDVTSSDSVAPGQPHVSHPSGTYYETQFIWPEDIFETFFGVAGATRSRYPQRTAAPNQGSAAAAASVGRRTLGIIQLLPLFLLLLMSVLTNILDSPSQPPYTLYRSREYPMARRTRTYGVNYFVKRDFEQQFLDRLDEIESNVDISHFSAECHRDKARLLQKLESLRFYGTKAQYQATLDELQQKELNSANCQKYRRLTGPSL